MINFLISIVVILSAIVVVQLVKFFELLSELKGEDSEEVNEKDNRLNARLMMVFLVSFFASFIWMMVSYKDKLLPIAASEHGAITDWLFNFNMIILIITFAFTHILLFYFAFKYYGRKGDVATYFPHNNKLEMVWTVIPAIVLVVIIMFGLKTWNKITEPAKKDSLIIELYAKQFDWTARYAGIDNVLGKSNFRLIDNSNPLGVDLKDSKAWDDIIVRGEFHIPVKKEVSFNFRSRDVIHSAYMPHFRAQMNCVPGMVTMFHFVPSITTAEMRKITKNENFDYILLCSKVCGAAHFNMQMTIIVDTEEDYKKWLAEQQTKTLKQTIVAESKEETTGTLTVVK